MKLHLAILNFFFLPILLLAQQQKPIWFHQIDVGDGLPSNRVLGTFMDSQGLVWTTSIEGLAQFNGHQVKKFVANPEDSTSLYEDFITGKFYEDKRSNIWFCTNNAIHCYHRMEDRFSHFVLQTDLGLTIATHYYAIALERDTFLWVRAGSTNSIYRFNIHTHVHSKPIGQTQFDIDIFPGFDNNGQVKYLFSVDETKSPGLELFELNGNAEIIKRTIHFDGSSRLPKRNISTVQYAGNDIVWMGGDSSLLRWKIYTNQLRKYPIGIADDHLLRFTPLDSNRLIVCKNGVGLYEFNKKTGYSSFIPGRLIDRPESKIDGLFRRPFGGYDGTIWIALEDHALLYARLDKRKFNAIPKDSLPKGNISYIYRNMVQDQNQNIWIGTYSDGLLMCDSSGKLAHQFHSSLSGKYRISNNQINHLAIDKKNNLWIASTEGLSVMRPVGTPPIQILDQSGKLVKNITFIYELNNGRILISTFRDGIYSLEKNGGNWYLKQILSPETGKIEEYSSIYQDSQDLIYLSHNNLEINIFDYGHELSLQKSIPLNGLVHGFVEDTKRKLIWIGTSNGLVRIKTDSLNLPPDIFKAENGTNIQSIQKDNEGKLWLGTSRGLVLFEPETKKFTSFTLADGMQSIQFDKLATMIHHDNSLWFGGNHGMTIIRPEGIKYLQNHPTIILSDLKINDKSPEKEWFEQADTANFSLKKRFVFSYQENTLSFSFVAVDYGDPEATQVEYFLEGVDEDWVKITHAGPGLARYPNLWPGKYTLYIRSTNSDGILHLSRESQAFNIIIVPPFWQRLWFFALSFCVVAIIIYLLIRYRINLIREKAEFQTRIAENRLTALRAQMNPHFLFNSLNSINNFVLGNKIELASEYLAKFAQLIRLIFDLSQHPNISLEEELNMLKLYLKVESMRFKTPFNYSINLANDIDPYEIQIPTMILQPFVENAIKHGIAHKENGPGDIHINISSEDAKLKCIIQDNGVGRKKSAEINRQKGRKHNSRGIDIIREQLEILHNWKKKEYQIKFEDLKNEQGLVSGTRVEILFPRALN